MKAKLEARIVVKHVQLPQGKYVDLVCYDPITCREVPAGRHGPGEHACLKGIRGLQGQLEQAGNVVTIIER